MKVVSFFVSLVMIAVGTWARVQYRSIHNEIHGNQAIQYGTLDECYGGGSGFMGGWSACSNKKDQPKYEPKEAVSSGVQSNPYLD